MKLFWTMQLWESDRVFKMIENLKINEDSE
jgi:hypothetical protein